MTAFWAKLTYFELVLYFDVFTKEIIGYCLTEQRGWPGAYYRGLDRALEEIEKTKLKAVETLEEGSGDITVIHTDQGSVYTSKAYNEIIKEKGIVRSCSRPGKPTDNPVNESLNGWIKEELFLDFGMADAYANEAKSLVDEYVTYYNNERPCWSLGYWTPRSVFDDYESGKVKPANTFKDRVLDETPKFIREKLAKAEASAENGHIGTSNAILA